MQPNSAIEIVEYVRDFLLKQGRKSYGASAGDCAYREESGAKCAVGCLIEDDEYRPEMEGEAVSKLVQFGLLPVHLVPYVDVLTSLQDIHDLSPVSEWPKEFERLKQEIEASNGAE